MTELSENEALRERVRDYIYDCTRDEFGHGWTLSRHQTDDLIAMIRAQTPSAESRDTQTRSA